MSEQDPILDQEVVHDQFTDAVLQAFGFIRKHSKTLIILVIVVVVASAIFVGYKQNQTQTNVKAASRYRELSEQYNLAETKWLSTEDVEIEESPSAPFDQVSNDLKAFFENASFSETSFVDRARYNYAKIQFYQGNVDNALNIYLALSQSAQLKNPLIAAYANQAIGNCYEQKGDYPKAINAYEKLRNLNFVGLDSLWIKHFTQTARLATARCYEQQDKFQDANRVYTELLEDISRKIQQSINVKSLKLNEQAKNILANLPDVSFSGISSESPYESFQSYKAKIHQYKIQKDIEGGLDEKTREKIKTFETKATDFSDNLHKARDYQSKNRLITAWRYYRLAVGIDGYDPDYGRQSIFDFAPNRKVYEAALFHHRRTATN